MYAYVNMCSIYIFESRNVAFAHLSQNCARVCAGGTGSRNLGLHQFESLHEMDSASKGKWNDTNTYHYHYQVRKQKDQHKFQSTLPATLLNNTRFFGKCRFPDETQHWVTACGSRATNNQLRGLAMDWRWWRIRQSRDSDEPGCHLRNGNLLCFFFLSKKKHMLVQRWYVFYACLSLSRFWNLKFSEIAYLVLYETSLQDTLTQRISFDVFSFKHVRCRSTVRQGGQGNPVRYAGRKCFFGETVCCFRSVLKRQIAKLNIHVMRTCLK